MRVLVLDDDFERLKIFSRRLIGQNFHLVETAKEAIDKLSTEEPFDFIFLDHDLGGQQMVTSGKNTGYEVALWIQEHEEKWPERVIVHSFNPGGAKNMLSVLPQGSVYIPGVWCKDSFWGI